MLGHNKQRRGFHLGSLTAHPFPGFPFIQQLIAHRHSLRLMLAIKSILALNHTSVVGMSQLLTGSYQGVCHIKICDSRIFDGGIFPAGALHPDSAGGYHDVAALYIQLDAAAGAHTNKGIRSTEHQLFHRN